MTAILMVLLTVSASPGAPGSGGEPREEAVRAEMSAAEHGRFLELAYAGPEGERAYRLYVPSGYDESGPPVPLVVMLHGCTQDAADFAAGTGMNEVADAAGVLVAYPEQPGTAHPQRCWSWYDPAHQRRGEGEPAILAGITREVLDAYRVDAGRVYLAGISAGGAMGAIMAAAYPDLYAAVGLHSALSFRAAAGLGEALAAMQAGGSSPEAQAVLAWKAMAERARAVPVVVFHGEADPVVKVVNAEQLAAQWLGAGDLGDDGLANESVDSRADSVLRATTPSGYHYERSMYHDAAGRPILEKWLVRELGHAWSGGRAEGTYTDPSGPDATRAMLDFFLRHRRSGGE